MSVIAEMKTRKCSTWFWIGQWGLWEVIELTTEVLDWGLLVLRHKFIYKRFGYTFYIAVIIVILITIFFFTFYCYFCYWILKRVSCVSGKVPFDKHEICLKIENMKISLEFDESSPPVETAIRCTVSGRWKNLSTRPKIWISNRSPLTRPIRCIELHIYIFNKTVLN